VRGTRRARDRHRTEVERIGVDRRTSRADEPIDQAPPPEGGDSRRVNEERRERVAGKRRPIDNQDLVALTRQQHGRRRPCAASSHDDCVVHPLPPCDSDEASMDVDAPRSVGEVPYFGADLSERAAYAAASARLRSPSFARTRPTWYSTVFRLMN